MNSIGRGCIGMSYAFLQCGYNRGFTLLGDVCRTPSADLEKSRQGFAIKHSSNMGVKGHLPHSGDVCWAPPADLGKSHWGLAIMHSWQFGVKWDQ